jgi:putative DNA primase/helicase
MNDQTTPSAPVNSTGTLPTVGQTRLAEQFATACEGQFIYVHGIGWHYWDGTRWAVDEGDARAWRKMLKILKVAWNMSFGDQAAMAAYKSCMSASAQNGALRIASIMEVFSVNVSDLDADPYLLNLANGTFDLRTGELRPHDPADRLTKVTRGAFDPDADRTEWEAFLERIIPDPEVRAYVQRLIGLSLLGKVREHILPIAIGTKGGNGKGTFYEAVLHSMGDYGHTAESDLFMKAKSNANAASPAIFSLRGRRFIVCSETEEGAPLAAALMKNLTGGDPITARALNSMPITFDPSHTALMVTNHLPKVKGSDAALWRRIRVIPFQVDIPEEEQDKRLGERLELSADAIISWALAGFADYDANGMQEPEAVRFATDKYRADSDDFGRFMASKLDCTQHTARTPRGELWTVWQEWCRAEDVHVGAQGDFYAEMDKHFTAIKSKGVRYFVGVQVVKDIDEDAQFLDDEEDLT